MQMKKNLGLLIALVVCLGSGSAFGAGAEDYRKAAEQGDAKSQYELGKCYDLGRGAEQDPLKAVEWYRKSAEQGNAMGQDLREAIPSS